MGGGLVLPAPVDGSDLIDKSINGLLDSTSTAQRLPREGTCGAILSNGAPGRGARSQIGAMPAADECSASADTSCGLVTELPPQLAFVVKRTPQELKCLRSSLQSDRQTLRSRKARLLLAKSGGIRDQVLGMFRAVGGIVEQVQAAHSTYLAAGIADIAACCADINPSWTPQAAVGVTNASAPGLCALQNLRSSIAAGIGGSPIKLPIALGKVSGALFAASAACRAAPRAARPLAIALAAAMARLYTPTPPVWGCTSDLLDQRWAARREIELVTARLNESLAAQVWQQMPVLLVAVLETLEEPRWIVKEHLEELNSCCNELQNLGCEAEEQDEESDAVDMLLAAAEKVGRVVQQFYSGLVLPLHRAVAIVRDVPEVYAPVPVW